MKALRIVFLLLIFCPLPIHAKNDYDYEDEDHYTFDELKKYLDIFEKKMRADLDAFETRVSSRLQIEMKRLKRNLQRRLFSKLDFKIPSVIDDKVSDLVKDGTVKKLIDNKLLDQVSRLQEGLGLVKTHLIGQTADLRKMNERQVTNTTSQKDVAASGKVMSELQDVYRSLNKSMTESEVLQEQVARTNAHLQDALDSLATSNTKMETIQRKMFDVEQSVAAVRQTVATNTNAINKCSLNTEEKLATMKQMVVKQNGNHLIDINKIMSHLGLPQDLICDVPDFPDGLHAVDCVNAKVGAHCKLECADHVPLIGRRFITCAKNSSGMTYWNWGQSESHEASIPRCSTSKCQALRAPRNGAMVCLKGTGICQLMCHEDYDVSMVSTPIYFCRSNHVWSSSTVHDCHWREYGEKFHLPHRHYFSERCETSNQEIMNSFRGTLRENDMCLPEEADCTPAKNIEITCGEEDEDYDYFV